MYAGGGTPIIKGVFSVGIKASVRRKDVGKDAAALLDAGGDDALSFEIDDVCRCGRSNWASVGEFVDADADADADADDLLAPSPSLSPSRGGWVPVIRTLSSTHLLSIAA